MDDKSKKTDQNLESCLGLNSTCNFVIVSITEFSATYFWIGLFSVRFIKVPSQF